MDATINLKVGDRTSIKTDGNLNLIGDPAVTLLEARLCFLDSFLVPLGFAVKLSESSVSVNKISVEREGILLLHNLNLASSIHGDSRNRTYVSADYLTTEKRKSPALATSSFYEAKVVPPLKGYSVISYHETSSTNWTCGNGCFNLIDGTCTVRGVIRIAAHGFVLLENLGQLKKVEGSLKNVYVLLDNCVE